MKIFFYSCKEDEEEILAGLGPSLGFDYGFCREQPTVENAHLAKEYPIISIVGTKVSDELLKRFAAQGLQCICIRCIGIDHVNVACAKRLGIRLSNITYSPNSVAEYALMLMLMCLRKARYILRRYEVNDYSLAYHRGRELRDMTVGIVGAGRIGRTLMKNLSGFGCRILIYDRYQSGEAKQYGTFVSYEELLGQSDIVSYHAPGTDETYHMLNLETVKLLKPGAVIINTSRGSNVDSKALIWGLEQGLIGAAGLDVIDNEPTVYNIDHKDRILTDHDVAVLESFPNVILTPHTAFYTDHSVRDMVENALKNAFAFDAGQRMPGEVGG